MKSYQPPPSPVNRMRLNEYVVDPATGEYLSVPRDLAGKAEHKHTTAARMSMLANREGRKRNLQALSEDMARPKTRAGWMQCLDRSLGGRAARAAHHDERIEKRAAAARARNAKSTPIPRAIRRAAEMEARREAKHA